MKNLIPEVLALGLLATLTSSCGETVNYDTQEKVASALATPAESGSDNAVGSNPGDSDGSSGSGSAAGGVDANGVPLACSNRTVQIKQEVLTFPEIKAGTTCDFGNGDNLSKKNNYFRAYLRQTQVVDLPVGAVLCGITLDHQPAAMRYDDEMFFSVNNKLLLSTKDYTDIFPKTDFFVAFNWENLKNKLYDSLDSRKVFCAGAAEGISSCKVPPTETAGNIEMTFSDEMNATLSKALRADQKLTFEWVTTGDDDNSDCRHTEIKLDLGLRYVMP